MSGLTSTGFDRKTFEQIITDLQARQRALVDATLSGSSTGVIANINASFAAEFDELWQAAQDIYGAHNPNASKGIAADHNGALSGTTRLDQRRTMVVLRLTLDANTTVVEGSVVNLSGSPSVRFATIMDVSTIAAGDVTVLAQCEAFGPINVAGGSAWDIVSPTSGWNGVANDLPAVPGAYVEPDAAYEVRRVEEIASEGGSTTAGVVADLRKLLGVIEVSALENETDDVDANGLPPHSFECIVHGGDPAAIVASIWENKPAGIEPVGTEPDVVTDSEGIEHVVRFTRPTLVQINLRYLAETDSAYDTVGPGIQVAINSATQDKTGKAYFGVGRTVYLARLQAAGLTAQDVLNLTINIARDPTVPSSSFPSAPDDKLVMGLRELPVIVAGAWTVDP